MVYLADFNVWVDDQNNIYGRKILEILDCFCLENLVDTPTHESGHTLDLIHQRGGLVVTLLTVALGDPRSNPGSR